MYVEITLDKVVSRLSGRAGADGLAVFVKPSGETKMTAVGTELYKVAMRAHPEQLLGVYDEDAEEKWIREDLRWASVNMVSE